MSEIRALTVRQPWAHMIAHGGKSIENRSRQTHYRGLLAIHAGVRSGWDADAEASSLVRQAWSSWARSSTNRAGHPVRLDRKTDHVAFGAVIAIANLSGCHRASTQSPCGCSPWGEANQWHWELSDVRALPHPVPCRGKLSLWRLPPDVETAVLDQVPTRRTV